MGLAGGVRSSAASRVGDSARLPVPPTIASRARRRCPSRAAPGRASRRTAVIRGLAQTGAACRRTQVGEHPGRVEARDKLRGERPPAGRLEARGRVVGRRGFGWASASNPTYTFAAWRLAAAAWSEASSSSTAITFAPRARQLLRDGAGQRRQPAELADHHAQVLERRADVAELFDLADRGHSWSGTGSGADRVERPRRSSDRTTPSASRPQFRWKSSSAVAVRWPKMPSTRPQSNPSRPSFDWSAPTSSPRMFGAISLSGRSPRRQDASTSASQVASSQMPVLVQAAVELERAQRELGGRAERAGLGARRRKAGRHRDDAAGRGSLRRVGPGSAGGNEKFVELLEQLALALRADEALATLLHQQTPAASGCSSR